jgi:hypothetical protein
MGYLSSIYLLEVVQHANTNVIFLIAHFLKTVSLLKINQLLTMNISINAPKNALSVDTKHISKNVNTT